MKASHTWVLSLLLLGLTALVPLPASAGRICHAYTDTQYECQEYEDFVGDQWVDCRPGLCNPCGNCHVAATTGKRFDHAEHVKKHYPKYTYLLRSGVDLPWSDNTYLKLEGDKICRFTRGPIARKMLCYPAGARILMDQNKRPALVLSDQKQTITVAKPVGP